MSCGFFVPYLNKPFNLLLRFLLAFTATILLYSPLLSQDSHPLFNTEEPIHFTITVDKSVLLADRGKDPQYHSGSVIVNDSAGNAHTLAAKFRARGHFRKDEKICRFAPLLINFEKGKEKKGSPFAGQNKLKMVMPCESDEYTEREYLLYKVYNLLTPLSLKVRRVKLTLTDSADHTNTELISGFLLEPTDQVAIRNNMVEVEKQGLSPEYLLPSDFALMAVFQFFAGNTDWSVQFQQNIELAGPTKNAALSPIPYDFDHAGFVNAPYAQPAEELDMQSVRERRYRGYCLSSLESLQPVFAIFRGKRKEIEDLYRLNTNLPDSYKKWSLDYINAFYLLIDQPKRVKEAFNYPCRPGGTGGVIIKGMKEQ